MMRNRVVALVGATALVTPLLPLALAPAYAADVAVADTTVLARTTKAAAKDKAADVWSHTPESGYQFYGALPAVDVRRATAEHTARKVVLTMSFTDLSKGGAYQSFLFQVRTKKMIRHALVYVFPGKPKGVVYLRTQKDADVSAKGIEHRVDYGEDKVRIAIPRRLLKKPAWVRVAMYNAASTDGSDYYQDNPHHSGAMGQQEWLEDPPLSMRIYPG